MPAVAAVAQASCSFSTQPFLYLVTHRGQLLESSNGKSKPGEPSCSSGGLAELSAAKEPAAAEALLHLEKLGVGRLPRIR